jgi:hypothetical protein
MTTAEELEYIYYACDGEDLFPIAASNTFSGLFEIVDDYMGANDKQNHSARRVKYEPYISKYGSDFEGTLYYEIPEEKTVKIYTVDFNYKKELE